MKDKYFPHKYLHMWYNQYRNKARNIYDTDTEYDKPQNFKINQWNDVYKHQI